MTRTFTAARIEKFERLLNAARDEAQARLDEHQTGIAEVRSARGDATADDEHDPEGPTMTLEWSQRSAVLHDAESEVREVDHAIERLAAGTYGTCANCGGAITIPRLEARPTATHCIDCARNHD